MDRQATGREMAQAQPERVVSADKRGMWRVRGSGENWYDVGLYDGSCTCPDRSFRSTEEHHRCKHWWAVWFTAQEPVLWRVRKTDERWCVALMRCGVRIESFGSYATREDAEQFCDLIGEMQQMQKNKEDSAA